MPFRVFLCGTSVSMGGIVHVFAGKVMSSKEIDRLMELVDKDGSGNLNYEEFISALFGK